MISPPSGSTRRGRYSRSPSGGGGSSSKRSKVSHSNDSYDRDHGNKSDQPRLYTSICVKNINPKISDLEIRDLCTKKFSKYGTNSVKIYHRNQERVAFVNFTNCEDARGARHAKTGLVWENMQVLLEPVYYRKTVPAEQPIPSSPSPHERSPPPRRSRRATPPSPSPPPAPSRSRSHHQSSSSSSRYPRTKSPIRSSRPPRRPYSPYIPLPPDLAEYSNKSSSRQRQRSSPSPVGHHQRKQSSRQKRSRSANGHRSTSPSSTTSQQTSSDQEPTRTLVVDNLERDTTESKLKELFARYGTIEDIDLKKSSSKRSYALIRYENLDMAYEARRAMNGQMIGKSECKIGYGKIVPSKHLWIGNIPSNTSRRDLEHALSRYGQIKTLDYPTGDSIAIVTYIDVEDAMKARSKLMGAIQILDGRIQRNEPNSSRDGLRIDYLDRPIARRLVNPRLAQKSITRQQSRSPSHHSSPASSTEHRERSLFNHSNPDQALENPSDEQIKIETHSRSPTPPIANSIKQRRSTEHSETAPITIEPPPIAGRTFYSPLGSYLSDNDVVNVTNIHELMILCEQLNASATKSNTALSTVYPVQFILKSTAYDARMHFLAGSPTLASILLGQPGDLVAAKTELRITQRLRLEAQKMEDLERKLLSNVINAYITTENITHGVIGSVNRRQISICNQSKFALLLATPKLRPTKTNSHSTGAMKTEIPSPNFSNGNGEHIEVKREKLDDETDEEDEALLSRLISYLIEKDAAGVISIPFYPTSYNDHPSRQEIAVLHIFPTCQFSKKMLKLICPSIHFSLDSIDDEHLMVVIVHSE